MYKLIVYVALVFGASNAFPGGYMAKGGVMDFKKPLDYMQEAVYAGKKYTRAKLEILICGCHYLKRFQLADGFIK